MDDTNQPAPATERVRASLVFPQSLWSALGRRACRNHRSATGEATAILEEALRETGDLPAKGAA